MDLSIVIPAYNEAKRIPQTLDEIRPFLDQRGCSYEVIVTDDGSSDSTVAVCHGYAETWQNLRCLTGFPHLGKGAAVKRGCLEARGADILVMDADHAIAIGNLDAMLQWRKKGFEIVAGLRAFQGEEGAYGKGRRIIGLVQLLLAHILVFQKSVSDSQCGFKLFSQKSSRSIFSRTRIQGSMYDVEVFFLAFKFQIPISSQPVQWSNKPGSTLNVPLSMLKDPFALLVIRLFDWMGLYR